MASVYDTIYEWARKTTTTFADLRLLAWEREQLDDDMPGDSFIYRLTRWPDLPSQTKTAGVLRALSVMSARPVNKAWIMNTSKLGAAQVDMLIDRLIEEDAVQVIDAAKFPPQDR